MKMNLGDSSYYFVPCLLVGAVASGVEDVPAAPHASASGRAKRDRARVGRIHIVVNVLCLIGPLWFEIRIWAKW